MAVRGWRRGRHLLGSGVGGPTRGRRRSSVGSGIEWRELLELPAEVPVEGLDPARIGGLLVPGAAQVPGHQDDTRVVEARVVPTQSTESWYGSVVTEKALRRSPVAPRRW